MAGPAVAGLLAALIGTLSWLALDIRGPAAAYPMVAINAALVLLLATAVAEGRRRAPLGATDPELGARARQPAPPTRRRVEPHVGDRRPERAGRQLEVLERAPDEDAGGPDRGVDPAPPLDQDGGQAGGGEAAGAGQAGQSTADDRDGGCARRSEPVVPANPHPPTSRPSGARATTAARHPYSRHPGPSPPRCRHFPVSPRA